MPTESASYIADLESGKPGVDEDHGEGYLHLNLIKRVLQATFPGGRDEVGGDITDPWDIELKIGPRFLNSLSDNLELSSYVTLDTDQAISGNKTFTTNINVEAGISKNGINLLAEVNGVTAVGSASRNCWLSAPTTNGIIANIDGAQHTVIHTGNLLSTATNAIFPVGSILFRGDQTNPSSLMGGVWERVAEGLFIVGQGTAQDRNGDTRTYGLGKAGDGWGEYRHTLTHAETPDGNPGAGGQINSKVAGTDQGTGTPMNNTPPAYGLTVWLRVS